jgi:hypothetical protein
MNPYIFLCFSALLLSAATHAQTDSSASGKPFGIKSGRIVYTFFAITASGERILTFDDWGNTFKEELTTVQDTATMEKLLMAVKGNSKSAPDSLFNMKMRAVQHYWGIRTPMQTWTIDPDRHIGYVTESYNPPELGPIPATVVGQDTILGKPCQVVEQQHGIRIWFWKNIPLKKLPLWVSGPNVGEHATLIDENYVIRPNEFKAPANIKIK